MKSLVLAFAMVILASCGVAPGTDPGIASEAASGTDPGVVSEAAPNVAADAAAFDCVISSDGITYVVGEVPKFTVRIHNKTAKDVLLVGALDGSDLRRYPKCRIEILDMAEEPVFAVYARCGNMNYLKTTDFVAVAAGESFDPYGAGFFSPIQFHEFPVTKPGTYTVRFYYTTSENLSNYYGDERSSRRSIVDTEFLQLIQRVPKLDLASNELMLTFVAKAEKDE